MGVFAIAITVALAVVGVAGGTAAYLYATDYEFEATVQDDCAGGAVPVRTKLFGIDHTVTGVPPQQCALLHKGAFVEYHVRSKHTTLYEFEGGRCLYDTVTGPFCGQGASVGLL